MKEIVFDIETLPAPDTQRSLVQAVYEKVAERTETFETFHRRTALNGNFGQILCIGYAINDNPVQIFIGDEADQLRNFWELIRDADRLIGHNIIEFDLPFIGKRSVIRQIQPSRSIPLARHASDFLFDTMKEWDNWAPHARGTSLDLLAKLLGFPSSKQGFDGSQVYDIWQAGRAEEIYAYCQRDVDVNRQIYRRLMFRDLTRKDG